MNPLAASRSEEHLNGNRESSSVNRVDRLLFLSFGFIFFTLPLSTGLSSIAWVVFVVAWIVSGRWKSASVVLRRPWFYPLMALIAVNALGLLWTEDLRRGLAFLQKMKFALVLLAGATLPWDVSQFRRVVKLFLLGLGINAGVGFVQWALGTAGLIQRKSIGPVGFCDHIGLSIFLCSALLWISFDFQYRTVLSRRWNGFLGMLFFAQLISTGGRTGQIAFLVLTPIAVGLLYRRQFFPWGAAAVGVAFFLMGLSPMFQRRYQAAVRDLELYSEGVVSTSLGIRLVQWEGSWLLARSHWIYGVGTGDFPVEIRRLQEAGRLPDTPGYVKMDHPHNSYLLYFASLGLVGLFALLGFLCAIAREAWVHRKQPRGWFVLAYLGTFLITGFADSTIHGHGTALLLYLVSAIPPGTDQMRLVGTGTEEGPHRPSAAGPSPETQRRNPPPSGS